MGPLCVTDIGFEEMWEMSDIIPDSILSQSTRPLTGVPELSRALLLRLRGALGIDDLLLPLLRGVLDIELDILV
jgi:hypothetical protein